LGEVTKEICENLKIRGVMLTGGDIAIKAAKLMKVSGVIIKDEIMPAVPYGYFISEQFSHIPIVTKAGGFGQEKTIINVVKFLKGVNGYDQ
ncbi:MAG: four-carbon acid sugar kinase family protein, partial [Clostridia bacterium]|nr:four-carbon acid sugar kinase family protein [Clostridia bacterium]